MKKPEWFKWPFRRAKKQEEPEPEQPPVDRLSEAIEKAEKILKEV